MATIIPKIESSHVINQLDTYTHTAAASTMYTVSVAINEIPPSGITVLIKQNSSTIASLSAPAAAQSVMNLSAVINATASDALNVVIASSTPSDQGGNSFKGILTIRQGLV